MGSLGSTVCPFSAKPTQIQVPLGSSLPARQVMPLQLSEGLFLPVSHPDLQSYVSPLPALGSSLPRL